MKLERQVTSLELSKKLKELGVKQESLFYWKEYKNYPDDSFHEAELLFGDPYNYENKYIGDIQDYSAFTVAELGEMLPISVDRHIGYDPHTIKRQGYWYCGYVDASGHQHTNAFVNADTEVDARAKMLIYLIEHKLIKI